MLKRNRKTNEYGAADFARHILCLAVLACVVMISCKSNRTSAESPQDVPQRPQQLNSPGLGDDLHRRLFTANANLGESAGAPAPASTESPAAERLTRWVKDMPKAHSVSVISPSPRGDVEAARSSVVTEGPPDAAAPVYQSASEAAVPEQAVKTPALYEPGMADQLISLNFDKVDIHAVLKTIGEITGINFVVDNTVTGQITVMSPTQIRLGDLYGVLESILDVHGYAAVPSGDLVKIVPKSEAAKQSLQVRIGSDPGQIPLVDSIVTQIMPLKYADAEEVGKIIKPFLATDSQMSTYARTNSIVVTDTSSNIHHLARIIQKLDVTGSKEEASVIPLKYASASVLSEQITRMMAKNGVISGQPPRNRNGVALNSGLKIMADERTNSIIVVANAQDTATIRRLIEKLDVERSSGSGNVHVVYLQNAQAKETAQSLTSALANMRISGAIEAAQPVQVTADESTNSLIIAASPQDFDVISQIIEKLDIVREQVLVEMLIVEVTEDSMREIGVDWATLDGSVDGSTRGFAATNFGPRVDFASGSLEGLAVGLWRGAGDNLRIGTILHALDKLSGVNILSTPHITTSNHNKAKIIVGENIPYVVESRITETSDFLTPTVIDSYDYKDVGITLDITPHISQGGLVRLEVLTEFTKLIEGATGTSANTPTTAKREAQTVVSMESGSTVVIGGLIRDDKAIVEKKVPLLGDLPVVGGLFRLRRDRLLKTNLLLFITPYRLGTQADLDEITQKKREEAEPALEYFEKTKSRIEGQ
ncbi:MAG: type II secretion system secretin GspD [Planctomycetota bacterium]|jgi:general secretion pathway protein D